MTKIKICGVSRSEDIDIMNEAMPDYVGFVFAKSTRQISLEKALELTQKLHPTITTVGVFVNEKIETIQNLHKLGIIDIAQLHGGESEDYCKHIDFMPTIKVISMETQYMHHMKTDILKKTSEFLLFDTATTTACGGTGISFDWDKIPKNVPDFFLAGGINSSNIRKAIFKVAPYGVDISSGVEVNGKKDRNKVLEIVQIIRYCDSLL